MAKKKNRKQYKQKVTTDKRVDMRTGGRVKAQRGGLRTTEARGPNLEVNLKPTPSVPPRNDEPVIGRPVPPPFVPPVPPRNDGPVIGRPVEPPLRRVTPAPEPVVTPTDPVMRGGPVGPGVPFTPKTGRVPPPRRDRPVPPPSVPPKEPPPFVPPPITPPPDVPPPDETPPPPPPVDTPAETPMTSREIAEAAARGEVPEAAQLPDAEQVGFQRDANGELILDEDGNIIAIAKMAKPVTKTNSTDYTFKLKIDL